MIFHSLHNFIIPWLHYFWILKNLKQKFNKGKLKRMKISYGYLVKICILLLEKIRVELASDLVSNCAKKGKRMRSKDTTSSESPISVNTYERIT